MYQQIPSLEFVVSINVKERVLGEDGVNVAVHVY